MPSHLVITSVEKLQKSIIEAVNLYVKQPGVFVSLNKTQKSTEKILKAANLPTDKLFFIDCMTSEKTRNDVLHISPNRLDLLGEAINAFISDIDGTKYVIIDALSTLLIYNDENKVAQFVKNVTELGSKEDVVILAFAPETKGEDLLNKIFNFFDEVTK